MTTKPTSAIETLRGVNENLRSALVELLPERRPCSSISPEDFSRILGQLLRAAECRQNQQIHDEDTAALEQEKQEYQRNLEKLKQFLPSLQVRLLAERSRLEAARTQVAAVTAWTRARREAL